MGMTVLYIAFGLVALWLLGEVLLQYKARLRWRALAFVGFLTVVIGVVLPSIVVIVLGAIAFAVGQTYVTMSFTKGHSTGWAIGGRPGASRRRRGAARDARRADRAEGASHDEASEAAIAAEQTVLAPAVPADVPGGGDVDGRPQEEPVYRPQPIPDDTGQLYGVYDDTTTGTGDSGLGAAGFAAEGQGGHGEFAAAAYDTYGGYEQPAGHDAYGTYTGYEGYGEQPDQTAYAQQQYQYGYADEAAQNTAAAQGGYADYGTGAPADGGYGAGGGQQGYDQQQGYEQQYAGYDASYGSYGNYGEQQQYQDPYASDTPPGGVWVPQQRDNAQAQEAAYDPAYGYDSSQQQQPEAGSGPYRY
ncbi:DUF1129 domain-containing protein [Streptomyces fuscigenes]|uniref:DUF1129 domain-containing protein n=1 Tax=Streptomyces fuscigenes TaxID=1528880 RepID=UPI001F3813FD|nr:DUF1129 domain-containing protein [Streptomyces fuscigenes]MCF3963428.1 DUF1129 domain-containing protein [Streptomyces fuscigenes]